MKPGAMASLSSIAPAPLPTQRTEWAERHVEEFLSIPFISEFVFRNIRTIDGKTPHQAGDFLILHKDIGILIEQKCQEDPSLRGATKTNLWARKSAKAGWFQLRRALTRPKDRSVWCDHPRRGRVEFSNGLPPIHYGLVIVEVFQAVDLQPEAQSLPLEHRGVPINYFSVNDFLNLAVNLRSVPELLEYLASRRSLPLADQRVIGDEKSLFEFYLLNGGSFADAVGRADARIAIAAQQDRLREVLRWKYEADHDAFLIEHVADALATRNPNFAEGLSPELLAAFDPADQRRNYLEIQGALSDLRLRERSELGRAFRGAIEKLSGEPQGFTYMSARLDSKPEWVYVFASSKNIERPEVLSRMTLLMRGAMAHYHKRRCLLVIDRDGEGYEVGLSHPSFTPMLADFERGQRLFGNLRVTSTPLAPVP
jgi:hypothetical protein